MTTTTKQAKPLTGIRVIDLTRVMSGPLCTVMLADLGADVIKVEDPKGDLTRYVGGHMRDGETAMFLALNRGKRSVSLDLRSDEGRAAVRHLVRTADVFVENFKPGVADAMGLDVESLRRENDKLIYASINGYGSDGAMAKSPAYDTVVQAQAGLVARQSIVRGEIDKIRSLPVDKLAGHYAAQAILAALFQRERSGEGAVVEIPMFDAAIYYAWPDVLAELTFEDGEYTRVNDTWRGSGVTKTQDGNIVFLAVALKEMQGALRAVGAHALAKSEEFKTLKSAFQHRSEFHRVVNIAAAEMETAVIVEAMAKEGVAVSRVLDAQDIVADTGLTGDDFFMTWEHPIAGRLRQPRPPIRFNRERSSAETCSPSLGEHTDEVLQEVGFEWTQDDEPRRKALNG